MKVKKIMTRSVGTCGPRDSLATAASIMWKRDCGIVPVVDGDKVTGVITDRDITIAVSSRGLGAGEIPVSEVAKRKAVVCSPDEKVADALSLMKKKRVRRLPVVDERGGIVGIFSIADALRATKNDKKLGKKVLSVLRDISAPCPIVLSEVHHEAASAPENSK